MGELKRRGTPAFLLGSPSAEPLAREGLHSGYFDVRYLASVLTDGERKAATEQGVQIAGKLSARLGSERDGDAVQWVVEGTVARAAAAKWIGEAGAVISDNDIDSLRKGVFLGVSSAGVANAVLQHGLIDSQFFPLAASQFMCWGPYFLRQIGGYGIPENRLFIAGCPRFDEFASRLDSRYDDALAREDSPRQAHPARVLVISTAHVADSYPRLYEAYFESVRNLLEAGIQVLVKLHPAELGLELYRRRLPEVLFSKMTMVPPAMSLSEALTQVDVVYQVNSTACLEAALHAVPVLSERGGGVAQGYDLPDIGLGVWTDSKALIDAVEALAHPTEARTRVLSRQREALPDLLSHLGHATEFTTDYLQSVASRGH